MSIFSFLFKNKKSDIDGKKSSMKETRILQEVDLSEFFSKEEFEELIQVMDITFEAELEEVLIFAWKDLQNVLSKIVVDNFSKFETDTQKIKRLDDFTVCSNKAKANNNYWFFYDLEKLYDFVGLKLEVSIEGSLLEYGGIRKELMEKTKQAIKKYFELNLIKPVYREDPLEIAEREAFLYDPYYSNDEYRNIGTNEKKNKITIFMAAIIIFYLSFYLGLLMGILEKIHIVTFNAFPFFILISIVSLFIAAICLFIDKLKEFIKEKQL